MAANPSMLHVLLPAAQRRLIGTLPNLQHRIAGTLYAEGDRTFVIEGFGYDGLGPDAFIYVYEKGCHCAQAWWWTHCTAARHKVSWQV